ncbi:MAG TPA: DNA repair protein RecO [Longilinea sp.]|nr:DNA repair protein RecO [Longilinea sp.]
MPRPERSLKVDAVIVRHSDWGEADRLLVLFTQQAGKLRAIAKGARRLRSRKAGHLEPFTQVSLLLAQGRDWWVVTQAQTIQVYQRLREDLERTALASYVMELIDRLTVEGGEQPRQFALVVNTLQRIDQEPDPFVAMRYFEMNLLELVGFRPELHTCTSCGQKIEAENQYLSAELGGAVCPRCGQTASAARPISLEALRFLRHYQRSPYEIAMRGQPPANIRLELETAMQAYFAYILERGLNTPGFLRLVRKD